MADTQVGAQKRLVPERTMPHPKSAGPYFAFLLPRLTRACCAMIFLGAIHAALAVTWTWNGNGGNVNWFTIGNWTPGSAPASAATTDLIFAGANNTGTALIPLNLNIANPFQLNSLAFAAGSG